MTLAKQIASYVPCNEQEAADKRLMLSYLAAYKNIYTRENTLCHLTASGWIVNADRTRVLMAYHNIYHSWSWTGGHADGETNLLAVACREACEETGLPTVTPVSGDVYSLEILTVDGHMKRGRYVSSHLHLNLTYLLTADETLPMHEKPDENSAVQWMTLSEAVERCTEPKMQTVYQKLNDKLTMYRTER